MESNSNSKSVEKDYHRNMTLNWAASASNEERFNFLRKLLDTLPDEELKQVPNLVCNAKKRRKRKLAPEKAVPVPVKAVPAPATVPLSAVTTLANNGWYRSYSREDVLALDVEKVDVFVHCPSKKKKFKQVAAKITLVDLDENVVYAAKIWHKNGSYRVTPFSLKINGIQANSLQNDDNIQLEEVKAKFENEYAEKLIVGVNLVEDFHSMDLPVGSFKIFDLQWHFWITRVNGDGVTIRENLGLRSLCKHFLNIDMQPPHLPHSDELDAIWTIRLFRDVYMKLTPEPENQINDEPTNSICHFSSLYK